MDYRSWLRLKAVVLRFLMRIGMLFHVLPLPPPPRPSFIRTIPAHDHGLADLPGLASRRRNSRVRLVFYAPPDYHAAAAAGTVYPVVVNFHGGGFCLGTATDDGRWARSVVEQAGALVVSVDYRLAPEHPFPAAVDDGVAALSYLDTHAADLAVDRRRVVITGFSAGGNLAFTVLLRRRLGASSTLSPMSPAGGYSPSTGSYSASQSQSLSLLSHGKSQTLSPSTGSLLSLPTTSSSTPPPPPPLYAHSHHSGSQMSLHRYHQHSNHHALPSPLPPPSSHSGLSAPVSATFYDSDHELLSDHTLVDPTLAAGGAAPNLNILAVFSYYPLLDFVLPRSLRRTRCAQPAKTLPPILTDLFDDGYVPAVADRYSPFASPMRASDAALRDALPPDVFLYLCEWDMLLREAVEFVPRLERVGKRVRSMLIAKSKHAWDKSVNPFRNQHAVDLVYAEAVLEMKQLFSKDE